MCGRSLPNRIFWLYLLTLSFKEIKLRYFFLRKKGKKSDDPLLCFENWYQCNKFARYYSIADYYLGLIAYLDWLTDYCSLNSLANAPMTCYVNRAKIIQVHFWIFFHQKQEEKNRRRILMKIFAMKFATLGTTWFGIYINVSLQKQYFAIAVYFFSYYFEEMFQQFFCSVHLNSQVSMPLCSCK